NIAGKRVLITGASIGIGLALAHAFLAKGAKVVITGRRADILVEAKEDLRQSSPSVWSVVADVATADGRAATLKQGIDALGGLDILVNNAGIETRYPFVETPNDVWQREIAVNLTGPFLCGKAAAKRMIGQARGGRIVNVSSIHEDVAAPTNAPYCAAKGGLRMLMRTMAVELAPHEI
ncbi:SDR family oxidoreductase, partial [Acidithiobacillus sp.]|uniref:SDR family NAD(P)-dependent oxidoreductase n=1 Tax=Acidithiobacillus sp. TaxID=1872118 RepID=UPI00262B71DD